MPPNPTPEPKRPGGQMHGGGAPTPTRSQLLPLAANWQDIHRKPYFVPGVLVVVGVLALFQLMGETSIGYTVDYFGLPVRVPAYTMVLATIILAGTGFAIHRMAGKPGPWWVMPAVAGIAALLISSPVMGMLQRVLRFGTADTQRNEPFVTGFVKYFFQAGLPEEALKAIPVLAGVWIARTMTRRDGPMAQFRVAEPLDGILIGAAAGLGFAFSETLFQYVPRTIIGGDDMHAGLLATFELLAKRFGFEHAVIEMQQRYPGYHSSLELMIPRLLAGICGHAAYAGIFGYYIGLAASRPERWLRTLLTGWCIAASVHAAWNASGNSALLGAAAKLAVFALLVGCIAKAREQSPERSRLIASQLIDRFARGGVPAAGSVAAAPARPSTMAAATEPAVHRPASTATPRSITWDDPEPTLTLQVGALRLHAALGLKLFERQVPGTAASRGDGVVAEVNSHPDDPALLGLRNLSQQVWHVTTEKAERRELQSGRSIRLAPGMSVLAGDLTINVR